MDCVVTAYLAQDHDNFSRVLALMRLQLDSLHEADGDGLSLLLSATQYLLRFPGRVHHPLEESLFRSLATTDPNAAEVLRQLRAEHAQLNEMGDDLTARIRLQQTRRGADLNGVKQSCTRFLRTYANHIRFEKQTVIPEARNLLSPTQREAIGSRFDTDSDPLFKPQVLALHDNLYDALMNGHAWRADGAAPPKQAP